MLEKFIKCIFGDLCPLPIEDEFVKLLRNHLSDKIFNDENSITTELYTNLKEQYETEPANFLMITRHSIPWMNELKKFPVFNKFKEMFANKLKQTRYWIGQFEYELLQNIIEKCIDIIIYIFNDTIPKDFVFKPNTIYLINLNETHYNYIIPKTLI